MESIYINPMQTEDVPRISEIEENAYGEHHWSRDSFYSEINNKLAKYYTARTSTGEIVGYLGTWHIVDEAHITTLAIDTEYRRKRISECLIVKMLEDCYNEYIKYITLEVRVSNIAAINLYKKYGFKSLGTRKGYYQDNNEDALIMWTENIFSDDYKAILKNNIIKLENEIEIK